MDSKKPKDAVTSTRREILQASLSLGAGGLALGAMTGCGFSNPSSGSADGGSMAPSGAVAGEDIKLVGIFPLSGIVAADGKEMKNGALMAIDEINEMGGLLGRKIKYVEIDDKDSLGDDVPNAFRRAVDVEKPDVIMSGYNLGMGPEFDILANSGTLHYNVNTRQTWVDLYKKNPEKYWSIFQADPTESMYGTGFALWLNNLVETGAYKPTGGKTAAILAGDDAYGSLIAQTFEEKIKELGWTISNKSVVTAGKVSDWGPLLAKVRASPPGILFTTVFIPADCASMAKAFAAAPIPCLLYQQYGPSVPEFLDLTGDAANGIIWATVLGRIPDDMGKDWVARYKAKFNAEPGWSNAPGLYDMVWLWAKAVALAGNPKDYRKIAKITEKMIHRGITGSLSFRHHTGVAYPGETNDPSLGQAHIIAQVQNKQHKVISPSPWIDTGASFQLPPWLTQ